MSKDENEDDILESLLTGGSEAKKAQAAMFSDFAMVATLILVREYCLAKPDPQAALNELLSVWSARQDTGLAEELARLAKAKGHWLAGGIVAEMKPEDIAAQHNKHVAYVHATISKLVMTKS